MVTPLRQALFLLFAISWSLHAERDCRACQDPMEIGNEELRTAVERSFLLLQKGATGSSEQRQCFTCHSQALPVFALQKGLDLGFKVDEEILKKQVQHTYEHLKRGMDGYREGKGQGGQVLTAGYALWTLDEANHRTDEVTEAVADYLSKLQEAQTHWHHHSNRPPSSDSDFTATYVALRGLTNFANPSLIESIKKRKEAVSVWLQKTKPKDTEDHVFRLGCFDYVDVPSSVIEAARRDLIALQRSDGGWSQNQELESDAYATGSAMAMLIRHGQVEANDPAIIRGAKYLLRTQLEDGSWRVKTRAKPIQTYFESGFPHDKDQFISIAGSSWACLALALCVNEPNPKSITPNDAQDAKAPSTPGSTIAKLAAAIPEVQTLVGGSWTQEWIRQVALLPSIEPKMIQVNDREIKVDEELYYSGRYGSPLAYARALDLAEQHGFRPESNARVLDFGYGSIGQLRMMALAGVEATGVDVAPLLPKLYEDASGKLGPGSVKLFHGKFPSDAQMLKDIGEGYDLFLSKNTLKKGYIHPSREVTDQRMLIQLGVSDLEFLQRVHGILKPGGLMVLYNFCPAKASAEMPYIPWAEGESPFSRSDLEASGFEILVFDQIDDPQARKLAHALGWDTEGKMNLERDLFAWFTIAKRK